SLHLGVMARSGVRSVAALVAGSFFLFLAPKIGSDSDAFVGTPFSASAPRALDCGRKESAVIMHGQGQHGRNVYGDRCMHGKPQVKAAKRAARWRSRKKYGSYGARQVPRRYPLYDILEELYDKVPTYTIVSEPDVPMEPVMKVPLTERYPWAGDLSKVHPLKQEKEHGENEDRMEPLWAAWNGAGHPPQGREQMYEKRMGWPTYNHPPAAKILHLIAVYCQHLAT
ncbi:unnamed protein product, partial [Effrenium voratum]